MIRAIIFDFDGLILETEEPTFKSWQEVYRSFGFSLSLSTYSSQIGTTHGEFDPRTNLEGLVKKDIDWETVESKRQFNENRLIEAQPVLPGAEDYLKDAKRLGLKIGLASNSPFEWVSTHLTRIGLINWFDFISTSDRVCHLKPHPELYLSALQGLDAQTHETFALEDSPPGIQSAKAAGLFCVAVPNILSRQLDLSQADLRIESLSAMSLEMLLTEIEGFKTRRAAF